MAGLVTPATSDLVHIFVDYSNVIFGSRDNLNIATEYFNIDLNRLIITVCNGRKLGKVFIAASEPSPEDDLWERAKGLNFIVNVFPRNAGREKKVDTQLTCDMMQIIHSENPGTLILLSGDSDFAIPLNKAKEKNWKIEIWSWFIGMSNEFKKFPYVSLKDHYESFAYITEPHPTNKCSLEINDNIIKSWKWKNEPIMECFRALNLLCRFHWIDNDTNHTTAQLYFDNENKLKKARSWLKKNYPNMLVDDDPFIYVEDIE
ncbi:hypothetical protein RclHR1_19470004 [Rhizophagus clarus]|uniref:NYN domain-containing protein n=1 Tax=Rhizophagus clarus TaxID=94130 RepID=A0A2Z6R4T4_9GLOM|nr:hypothetical protein RclHR1_19470004 [Rhizophagus clarus]GET01763.1 NYN domain-containing protein [Rhizophagus clarus]